MNVLSERFGDSEILVTENGRLLTVASALMSASACHTGARVQVARTLRKTRASGLRPQIVERGACWRVAKGKRESLMRIVNA